MPFELSRVVEILDASDTAHALMVSLVSERVNKSAELFVTSLAQFQDKEKISQVLELYGGLDQARQMRVLVSAELGEVLNLMHSGSHEPPKALSLETILDIVAREHAISLLDEGIETDYFKNTEKQEVFSPLGDRIFRRKKNASWVEESAHVIDGLIVVDFDSPIAMRHEPDSGTLSNERLEISEVEKAEVVRKLTHALRNIDRARPLHGQIIRNFVRRIVVRKSIESDRSFNNVEFAPFGSEHRPIHPSSLRMLNVHHPQNTIALCMEALFHETVHNVLAYWETVNEYFAPSARDVRPISPWTGNAIPNHSFAHAVFVWYGLHRLFESCITKQDELHEMDAHDTIARLRRFGLGFLGDRPLTSHFTHSTPVHAELKTAIDVMQLNIKKIYGALLEVA